MTERFTRFLFVFIFCLAGYLASAQKITTFQHSYGVANKWLVVGSVVQLADKGYIMSGAISSQSGLLIDAEILLIRVDSLGRKIWSKGYYGGRYNNIGYAGQNDGGLVDMTLAPDGNILVGSTTGSSNNTSTVAFLFKIDLNGNVLWANNYENKLKNYPGTNLQMAINDPSGGYILVGNSDSIFGTTIMAIKTNSSGAVTWAKSYYDTTNIGGYSGENQSIIPSIDGGYFIGTSVSLSVNTYNEDYHIIKIDKNGKFLWNKEYGTYDSEYVSSIVELPDKSIYVFGHTGVQSSTGSVRPTIQKLDSSGNIIWSKQYHYPITNANNTALTFGYGLYDTSQNLFNLTISGYSNNTDTFFTGITRLDTSGRIKQSRIYNGNYFDYYHSSNHNLIKINSGGLALLTGNLSLNFSGNISDFYLVKADGKGNTTGCNIDTLSPNVMNYPVSIHYKYNLATSPVSLNVSSKSNVNNISTNDYVICPPFVAYFSARNICLNQSVQFYDSTYYNATNWKWDFGDTTFSTLPYPTHQYAHSGTYKVKLVAGNGTAKDSITKTITVYPLPTPFKFDTLICGGSNITLRASGGATYKWSPAKLVSNATSATPSTSPKRTTNFIVQAISAQGCITYDTVHVTVDNKPSAPQIDYATIKTNSEIDVKFQRSDSNDVSAYEVFRSVNSGAYSALQTINNPSNTDSFYVLKDLSVNAATNKYAYKILAVDSCGSVGDTSIVHQTMVLAVKQLGCVQTLQLNWNAYIGWASIKGYEVFRSINSGIDSLIGSVANNITTYNDTGLNHKNLYCYKILAIDNMDSFVSQSNTICKQTFFPDTPQVLSASKISTSTTNGTVVIKWNTINKANLAYNELFFSRNGVHFDKLSDPVTLNDQFPPGIDSFAQIGLDTKDSDYFYYLVTVDSCGAQSVKSPTSKTMILIVTVGELLHKLNWTPYQGFKVKEYYIERFEKGQFVTIDSVPGVDTASREFPAPCNYAIRYRIAAIGYDSGEVAWSDTMGRQAIDTIPSDPPVMLNATVLNGVSAKINFVGSDSADTYQFVIQRSTDGNWGTAGKILYTNPGDSLQFVDNGINTIKNHYCYTIITLDSCLNASESDTFCLINLQGEGEQMSDSLNWYPFVGYGLNSYTILTLNQLGTWDTLIAVNQNDTDYYNANLKCNQTVTYKIEGKEKSGTRYTFSDSITLTPFDTIKPPAPQLYYASVLPNQTVKLSWQWNLTGIVKYFEIWRSTNKSVPVLIDTVIADSVFIDKNADVKDSLYSYSVIAIDSCNTTNRSKHSQTDSLMRLKLYSLYCIPQVQIRWTHFTGLPNGVSSYNILRSTDGVNFTSDGTVNASTTVFIDNSVTIGKQYYYKAEAIDNKSGYVSYSDTLGVIPKLIPLADSAQLVYATVLKSDETNGEIYVQWKRALRNDTNARGYYVYSYNPANGKYALIKDATDLNDTSYIQNNINTLQNAYKYYIVTYNVCDVGINSNIHKTILLQVQGQNLSSSLKWNNYFGIPVKSYSVYRSKDGGAQYLVSNAGLDSTLLDSNITCNHNYTYQIQAVLANGEISFSDSVTVKSYDTIKPVTKPIIVTTVAKTGIRNGKILLNWNAATDNNLEGYNIYRSGNGFNWVLIRQQYPGTSLIDTLLDTYDQSYYYKIQPVDSCGNDGPFTIYHETIHLYTRADNGFNHLFWNGYMGWNVKKYLVYKNGSLIDTLANNVFEFKDSSVICNVTYQYLVKAIDSSNDTIISASNTDSAKALNHIPPQRVYIKTVTVSKPNKAATITWTPSTSYDVKNYFIYRKSSVTGAMQFIGSTNKTFFIDSSFSKYSGITEPDCYYVFTNDNCSNQSDASNQGCIILLNATNQPGSNELSWYSYKDWQDGVQSYNVYKNEDSLGWQLIGTTSSVQVNEFKDSKLGDSTIDFCYQVEAIENPGQYNQLSRSTVECVHQDATVFIPNTFTPYDQDGLNDYFGPIGSYVKNYSMKIYNRWGELMYNTNSGKAWDGTFQGQFVQQGVYIYLITVTDYNGKESYFKGTITMFE